MPIKDKFENFAPSPDSPPSGSFAITPSDTELLPMTTNAVYVGVTGSLRVEYANGDIDTMQNIAQGMQHPMRIIRVFATGTTATGLSGKY